MSKPDPVKRMSECLFEFFKKVPIEIKKTQNIEKYFKKGNKEATQNVKSIYSFKEILATKNKVTGKCLMIIFFYDLHDLV